MALPKGPGSLCPEAQQVSGDAAHPWAFLVPAISSWAEDGGCDVDGASDVTL